MSISVPGVSYANPGSFAESEVVSSALSIPANNRILCVMGEGKRREVLVNAAKGGGADGLNPSYTASTAGIDGRHFKLSTYPVVSNRTELLKNGVPLVGLEQVPDANTFSYLYDYRIDILTGKIELQRSRLYDYGGSYYQSYGTNKGNGTISNLTLVDDNAPGETWTIRCTAVQKDGYGAPIAGYAKFVVSGSISGIILDGYGSPIIWQSDSVIRTNDILRFEIDEGATAFNIGDTFTIAIVTGMLKRGDSLVANYIGELDLNDPEFFTDPELAYKKHGLPALGNELSLGLQMAFTNQAPGVLCIQCAPPLPRRTSVTVVDTASGGSTMDDLLYQLPIGMVPDENTEVKFFTVDHSALTETQFIPNKVSFYNTTYKSNPDAFCHGSDVYSYTVITTPLELKQSETLILTASGTTATIEADVGFDLSDVGPTKTFEIYDATNAINNGAFVVTSVADGILTITKLTPGSFISEDSLTGTSNISFRLYDTDPSLSGTAVLLTSDLAPAIGTGLKVMVIDIKDALFYDAGWVSALETLEAFELDMLCPLPKQTISAIFQNTVVHCINMTRVANKKERVALIGAIRGLTPDNVTGVSDAAVEDLGVLEGIQGDDPLEIFLGQVEDLANYSVRTAFGGTNLVEYFYPDEIVVNVSGTNQFLDGFYMAPAAGGYYAANANVAIPITNKIITGFSILRNKVYNQTVAENITKEGITLVQPVLGGGKVIWGKTTSQSGFPEDEEMSIIFIRNKLAKMCRAAVDGLIGQPDSETFPVALQARIVAVITNAKSQRLITNSAALSVSRNATEPRQWDVRFKVQPTYAANWIYIKFGVGVI